MMLLDHLLVSPDLVISTVHDGKQWRQTCIRYQTAIVSTELRFLDLLQAPKEKRYEE